MPEYLSPGVYVEETTPGPRPIEGVPTSTAAFLGEAERGPIKPRLVTSVKEYERWFGGGFGADKFLPDAVRGFFDNGGKRLVVCRLVGGRATSAQAAFGDFGVRASGPGSWGRRVWVRIDDSSTRRPDAAGHAVPVGFRIRVAYWSSASPSFQPFDPFADAARLPRPTFEEAFDDLVADAGSADFYEKRLLDHAALVTLIRRATAKPTARPPHGSAALAELGADDPAALGEADYNGAVVAGAARRELQGLAALELDDHREVALIYAPAAAAPVANALVSHCERLGSRFAVVDCEKGVSNLAALEPRMTLADTSYAAFYFPWLVIRDPQSGAQRSVPPGGHVLGVYARTDTERGVFKSPANQAVRGALALELDIGDAAEATLSPRGVNVIRRFPDRGILVWGARTLTSDPQWKYVSVRRLFIFLERSIRVGTQWVVFEPNDEDLWARVRRTIENFLMLQWRDGALMGETPQKAFFVICDRRTMTQNDLDNGRLVCEIGIAPVRPAEFVIFRICHATAPAHR